MSEQSSQDGPSQRHFPKKRPQISQSIPDYVEGLVTRAREAANRLATLSTSLKNQALLAMADALEAQSERCLKPTSKISRHLPRVTKRPWPIVCG